MANRQSPTARVANQRIAKWNLPVSQSRFLAETWNEARGDRIIDQLRRPSAPLRQVAVDLQERQMRSPAHSLSKGFLQIRHARVFTCVSCSISESSWSTYFILRLG
jgi:hypothetical protein